MWNMGTFNDPCEEILKVRWSRWFFVLCTVAGRYCIFWRPAGLSLQTWALPISADRLSLASCVTRVKLLNLNSDPFQTPYTSSGCTGSSGNDAPITTLQLEKLFQNLANTFWQTYRQGHQQCLHWRQHRCNFESFELRGPSQGMPRLKNMQKKRTRKPSETNQNVQDCRFNSCWSSCCTTYSCIWSRWKHWLQLPDGTSSPIPQLIWSSIAAMDASEGQLHELLAQQLEGKGAADWRSGFEQFFGFKPRTEHEREGEEAGRWRCRVLNYPGYEKSDDLWGGWRSKGAAEVDAFRQAFKHLPQPTATGSSSGSYAAASGAQPVVPSESPPDAETNALPEATSSSSGAPRKWYSDTLNILWSSLVNVGYKFLSRDVQGKFWCDSVWFRQLNSGLSFWHLFASFSKIIAFSTCPLKNYYSYCFSVALTPQRHFRPFLLRFRRTKWSLLARSKVRSAKRHCQR